MHRPRYDDWSFPKGKLEPGEPLPRVRRPGGRPRRPGCGSGSGRPLPTVRYALPDGRPRRSPTGRRARAVRRRPRAGEVDQTRLAARVRGPHASGSPATATRRCWTPWSAAPPSGGCSPARSSWSGTRRPARARPGRAPTPTARWSPPAAARRCAGGAAAAAGGPTAAQLAVAALHRHARAVRRGDRGRGCDQGRLSEDGYAPRPPQGGPARAAARGAGAGRRPLCTHRPVLAGVRRPPSRRRGTDEVRDALPDGDPFLDPAEVLVAHVTRRSGQRRRGRGAAAAAPLTDRSSGVRRRHRTKPAWSRSVDRHARVHRLLTRTPGSSTA